MMNLKVKVEVMKESGPRRAYIPVSRITHTEETGHGGTYVNIEGAKYPLKINEDIDVFEKRVQEVIVRGTHGEG